MSAFGDRVHAVMGWIFASKTRYALALLALLAINTVAGLV